MQIREYKGRRDAEGRPEVVVCFNGEEGPLPRRLDLKSLSPETYAWGHTGRAALQLAIAILADHYAHAPNDAHLDGRLHVPPGESAGDAAALANFQAFAADLLAPLPQQSEWSMASTAVHQWLYTRANAEKATSAGVAP